jgi:hypothetical protein
LIYYCNNCDNDILNKNFNFFKNKKVIINILIDSVLDL